MCPPCVHVSVSKFPLYIERVGLGILPIPGGLHFNQILHSNPISKEVHILRHWGFGFQHIYLWGEHNSTYNIYLFCLKQYALSMKLQLWERK